MALNKSDLHFLQAAKLQGEKSSFSRKKRGSVLVKFNKIIASGISSHLNENTGESQLHGMNEDEKYVATVNAEVMAIAAAVKAGIPLSNCSIYVSDCPNWLTFKYLAIMGIKRILFYGPVYNQRINHYAQEMGIEIIGIGPGQSDDKPKVSESKD